MISEFKIRQELRAIELAPALPIRRARRILQLARSVRKGARQMSFLSRTHLADGDGIRAVRFMTAARRLCELYEELRACARAWLPASVNLGRERAWKSTFLIPEIVPT